MNLVVNDASLLFDLLDIGLIDDFCQLPYQKSLTDAVLDEFDEETFRGYKQVFEKGLLTVYYLTADQVNKVKELKKVHSATLSFPDCSCLFLAKELSAILLTGDKALRKTARAGKIKVHGTLWVLDQLLKENIISYKKAHRKLSLLMQINRRLPRIECNKRLHAWASRFGKRQ